MSDNVIKFSRPKPKKAPRQTPPWLHKLLVAIAIIVAIGLVYTYYALTLGPS